MEIKKADSKGRVTGFKPNTHYVVDKPTGRFSEFTLESVQPIFPALDKETQPLSPETGTNATLAGMQWVVIEEPDGSLTVTPVAEV